jgi:hypothetical protein
MMATTTATTIQHEDTKGRKAHEEGVDGGEVGQGVGLSLAQWPP